MIDIRKQHKLWLCLLLALVTIAVYAQVYHHDFIEYDDADYVFENWHVATGLNLKNLIWAFTTGHSANWHPLTWLSHQADSQIFGLNAGLHHLVNVLFHVANALLLFGFLSSVTGARWRSAFVAALFALHPLHVESVAWVAERKDVLSTLFWILTLWAYAAYTRKPERGRYLLALAVFALGLMSKPMLVTLPFVLLLMDIWPLKRFSLEQAAFSNRPRAGVSGTSRALRAGLPLVREKAIFFLLAAASSTITFFVQKSGGAVVRAHDVPIDLRIANVIHSYAAYVVKMVWPTNLSIFYPYPDLGFPAWKIVAATVFLSGLSVTAFRFAGRFPFLFAGWFWYVGTLVPVVGLVQVGAQAMADRYTYVPLIGLFIVIAWAVPDLDARRTFARAGLGVAGSILVLGCAITTWFQVRHWRDTISLFSHALRVDPGNYLAHGTMGIALGRDGKFEDAVKYYSEAVRLRPLYLDMINNLGYALYKLGRVDEALQHYSRVLSLQPGHPYALRNLGHALYEKGKYREAIQKFQTALQQTPDDLLLQLFWGNALARLGRDQEAIDSYKKVLLMQPKQAEAYLGLGSALAGQGKAREAIQNFEKAMEINPDYAEAHNNLGIVYYGLGQMDKALFHCSEALRLKPDYAEARYNLGIVLYGLGKAAEAMTQYERAVELNPDYAEAFYNLGAALADQGRFGEAISKYLEAIRLKPDYAEAYNNLGIAFFNAGQVQRAIEAFSEALRVRPDYADARRNLDLIRENSARPGRNP